MTLRNVLPGIPLVESPLFRDAVGEQRLNAEELQVALDLHEHGYAVIDFPDDKIEERIESIKQNLSPRFGINFDNADAIKNKGGNPRIQDAWLIDENVRAIAANKKILALLEKVYGRRAFPFQTLNFPVGTEQHLHSDSNHFSSIPERFMCGVWLAMEDVDVECGPLTYIPGSHKWPIITNIMIGRRASGALPESAQAPFHAAWNAMIGSSGKEQQSFLARKGQALIWAANILHGGSPQRDPRRTRWSQVSHYYFEDCIYYTPGFSDEAVGSLELRTVTNIVTGEIEPSKFLGEELPQMPVPSPSPPTKTGRWRWQFPRRRPASLSGTDQLPPDFDPATYLQLNPDVATADVDAREHYLKHGARERRRYRRG